MSGHIESIVLDSEGLSAWIAQDRQIGAMFQVFHDMGADLVVSANTIVEVSHSRLDLPRLQWALSRARWSRSRRLAAKAAAQLLKDTGLHGHKYAIDATVAETALRRPGPAAILTSDVDGMTRLCGSKVRIIGL
ncbi:DNA-binding protein [Streptomyces turgidiscabies]|uniref:PIN domain-containing protein n=1 Tax=Streptomyces turgidiscabies (strain Car8) TaxID=698760 RepID=L7FHZ0_STRT8|nr:MULTISPECIES: hypothetical protein [Streptomyces]ELP70947.1 hypothetical protein STRTUCAR8_05841 [Streptomyces turgidiscabies Car8]MDX3499453.1 DNA-binding protein [Streptomyces turgidiscabies]